MLGFAYLEGKNWKNTEFSADFVNTCGNKREVGVLCQWHTLSKDNVLSPVPMDVHGYFNIK